ncbi:MAG: hypothetical protein U0572_03060 [Phycisphaerales bacterium]
MPTRQGIGAFATDVNDAGEACGYIGSPGSNAHAFVWASGALTFLPTPPGAAAVVLSALNASRHACGTYRFPLQGSFQPRFPFYWNGYEIVDLGILRGLDRGYAYGINNLNCVVGYCEKLPLNVAFVWRDGVMTALDDLLEPGSTLHIKRAWSINDSGQIAADAATSDGEAVAVLLTPVPPIPGDVTCDWAVGGDDLAILLGAWGACPLGGRGGAACPADIDANGAVDAADLGILLGNWSG